MSFFCICYMKLKTPHVYIQKYFEYHKAKINYVQIYYFSNQNT